MKGTTAAWLAFVAAATYRWEKHNTGTLPPPSIYLGAAAIYSILGIAAQAAPQPAALFGWALVVAALTTGALLPADPKAAGGPHPSAPGARRITPAT